MLKKTLRFFLYPFLIVLILTTGILSVLFLKPQWVVNVDNLKFVLRESKILKSWSWSHAHFEHQWNRWNDRGFKGAFKDLCFEYKTETLEMESCVEEFSWDLRLLWTWEEGGRVETLQPLYLRSRLTSVSLAPSESPPGPPSDIWNYWTLFWSDVAPDMDLAFDKIRINTEEKTFNFDLKFLKVKDELKVEALGYHLWANPEKFKFNLPEHYEIPKDFKLDRPLYLHHAQLEGAVKRTGIRFLATGQLEVVDVRIHSFLKLPLTDSFTTVKVRRDVLLATSADLVVKNVKTNLEKHAPKPYNVLPAPFNVMDGEIRSRFRIEEISDTASVLIKGLTSIDLTSPKQSLLLDISTDIPLNVRNFNQGIVAVGVDFKNVTLELPRLSKKSPPPQFMPDGRFKKTLNPSEPKPKKDSKLSLDLVALDEQALHLRTNLLDEPARLNFDIRIREGELQNGFLKILPLKTTVFKRPIHLQNLILYFKRASDTTLQGKILFPLPEYKITLNLEGPLSDPRYAFTSKPPLPQDDIFAVLLFGRPLADLDPDNKAAASRTNQILAQGILSLSVLYFLAGSPVEYVGYDPNSQNATAQFGLGKKSSLRVGGGREGVNSTAIRRSLGKGWYLDTSVQSSTSPTDSDTRNYGVLLERIIAY